MGKWNGSKSERRAWARKKEVERLKAEYYGAGSPRGSAKPARPTFKKFHGRRKKMLLARQEMLAKSLPASEQWFHGLYREAGLAHPADRLNEIFCNFIPDVVNHELRYVIEVQDPSHKLAKRARRDRHKARVWAREGYRVFAVWAWQEESFTAFSGAMREYRTALLNAQRRLEEMKARHRVEKELEATRLLEQKTEASLTFRTILRKASKNT